MHTYIRQFLAVLLFVSASLPGRSQNLSRPSPDSIAAKEARVLRHRLSLTTKQQHDIEQLIKTYHLRIQNQYRALQDTASKGKALRRYAKDYKQGLKKILTPAQSQRHEAMLRDKDKAFREQAKSRGIEVKELKAD